MSSAVLRATRLVLGAALSLLAFGLIALLVEKAVSSGLAGGILNHGYWGILTTIMGVNALWVIVILVLALVGGTAGHFAIIGAKHFSHEGDHIDYFTLAARLNHLLAALSCTTLVLTGATMMAGSAPGTRELLEGTGVVEVVWKIHGITAIVFAASALLMLLHWSASMIPKRHDLTWFKIMGGYLSRENRPVPAHKFNAGQKMWFWTATLGGFVLGATGLLMHLFVGGTAFLNNVALVHHVTATLLIMLFGVHLYMVLFAISGAMRSMIGGTKSRDEVSIMHSLYYNEILAKEHGELALAARKALDEE